VFVFAWQIQQEPCLRVPNLRQGKLSVDVNNSKIIIFSRTKVFSYETDQFLTGERLKSREASHSEDIFSFTSFVVFFK